MLRIIICIVFIVILVPLLMVGLLRHSFHEFAEL